MENAPVEPPRRELAMRDRKRLKTQSKLYDCAVELIIQKGYDQVSVDEICLHADVGRATFFRYFGSKSGLMIEFDRRIVADIEERTARSDMSTESLLDIVQSAIASAWLDTHPNLRALGLDYLSSTAISDLHVVAADITGIAKAIFQRGIDSGELKSDLPAELLASIYVTSIRMGIYRSLGRGQRTRIPNATRLVLDFFMNGLNKTPLQSRSAKKSRPD